MLTYLRMARVRNWWSNSRAVVPIWVISAILFYSLLQLALRNSSSDKPISNQEQRSRLYDKMSRDLDEHGAAFLKHGETSQSLSLSDLFTIKDGSVTPNLKAAIPPVRANVLYLSPQYSIPISKAVRSIFLPHFDKMIWFQNSTMYHFSMFHASHHITPVPATEEEIEAEANAVKAVAEGLCPLKFYSPQLNKSYPNSMASASWIHFLQVVSGMDPITIRAKLRPVLPRAPEKQLYDAAILHTSFARLLGQPNASLEEADKTSELQFFHDLVTQLNNQIHGFQATVTELWYVEELDVLALALDGRMKVHKFQLGCSKT
ncbi:hypothetical protein HYC85_029872 [Camellia sinensis]|uniref:Uncharacterized protein n=1 Tax=Camellia sinensis TaxID=4442 RepID=A0A7J7G0G3_CAMSI|nr:hypothetical protein HYC85_029872 [Camellia sinensis]